MTTITTLHGDIQGMNNLLQEINIKTAKMEEHMAAMNGKLLECQKHVQERCPEYRDIYAKQVTDIKVNMAKTTAIVSLLSATLTGIVVVAVQHLIGG